MFHHFIRFTEHRRESQKHPRLGPSHVGSPDRAKTKDPVVEESPFVPHVIHGPAECRARKLDIRWVEAIERERRDNALRHGVNVDGVSGVVKVSRGAVFSEKESPVELKTTLDR